MCFHFADFGPILSPSQSLNGKIHKLSLLPTIYCPPSPIKSTGSPPSRRCKEAVHGGHINTQITLPVRHITLDCLSVPHVH